MDEEVLKQIKKYFELSPFGFIIVMGLIGSGLSTLNTSYDLISQINAKQEAVKKTPEYEKALHIKFIVMMVLSCVALLIGIILGFVFKNNPKAILTFGLAGTGLVGIFYSASLKIPDMSGFSKLGISLGTFILFVLMGIIFEINDKEIEFEIFNKSE